VTLLLRKLRDALIGTDRALREGTSVAQHDALASARRPCAVLDIYSPLFIAGSTQALRLEWQYFGAALAGARDLEILHIRLTSQLIEEPADYAVAAKARLDSEVALVMPAAQQGVAELICSERYLQMLWDLDLSITEPRFYPPGRSIRTA